MFTELNKRDEPGLNHIHMLVDSLAEAQEACDFYGIPVITVGFPDRENELEKARASGGWGEAIVVYRRAVAEFRPASRFAFVIAISMLSFWEVSY